MTYQAAIFDFDGTLIDTLEDLADCMNAVLAQMGMPTHPIDPYRYFVGDGMENLARRAAPEKTPDADIKKMAGLMAEKYAAGWSRKTLPYNGIPELLAGLKARGMQLAILSNKPDDFTKIMARHYFGDKLFTAVFGARDSVPKKPDPAGAIEIAKLFGLQPAEFLYFGDTNTDMRTGRAAGMRTIGVAWGFRPVEELNAAGAQAIITSPSEALGLLL